MIFRCTKESCFLSAPSSGGDIADVIESELGLVERGEDLVAHGLEFVGGKSESLSLVNERQKFGELGFVDLAIAGLVDETEIK